jgi:hypothetical protein
MLRFIQRSRVAASVERNTTSGAIGALSLLLLISAVTPVSAETTGSCAGAVDPYKNYACLDAYLGDGFFERLANYYRLEDGQAAAPSDPDAPASRRDYWPATPQTTPPMPFTEWPHGATTALGVTRPASADSPLMAAIANTSLGAWMSDNHMQFYGWANAGFNVSSNSVRPGGNFPVAYAYTPNTVQLDQIVLYLERLPDTVQKDHVDWGFRLSALYGENYRYTTAYGIASYQLLRNNQVNGYDFPMVYGELFIPQVAEGLLIRVGRYISIPDIEAQLAPNNYMYTHSLSYGYDNYTNEGIVASLAVTPNLTLQMGVVVGTEAAVWHWGETAPNPFPNALYPGKTFLKDPGAKPSIVACLRYVWNDGKDDIYPCIDGINNGAWGYNNLQWMGFTYYHKFDDRWHVSFEAYNLHQNGVANADNPIAAAAIANGGTPFSPQYMPYNAPGQAHCGNDAVLRCRASAIGTLAYINYSPDALNNFSLRPEFYWDKQGQRTGVRARYVEVSLGWQHWLSPQIEMRPEIGYYRSIGADAFNGNSNAGIAPNKNYTVIGAADLIVHF